MNYRPPERFDVDFVDWPFSKLKKQAVPDVDGAWREHLKTVRGERPRYAVAPDADEITGDWDWVLDRAADLERYAETVIVVPKIVHPRDVPGRYRVGLPCQERYGPSPHPWTAYRDCPEVHLLGGSPVKQVKARKYGVPVESADTTSPLTAARWQGYFDGTGWTKLPRGRSDFYECVRRSYKNLRYGLNPDRDVWSPRPRNAQYDYEEEFFETHPDADCWADDDAPSRFYEMFA
ncbi:hypothetical protein JMJ58_19600 [Haloterrigena salifodinae]|uniref:Uncharacterized protein n=1 Tax=Haloterrigena salifodinae TaxID=2675099 RepID=A0A8T8E0C3_9EURY|nr:DUF6610 family protein [Haloterrigena salifodinae]QRV15087.1 hypothetical protein JMJ58_19600 [Haloterrigena salifodinae]